MLDKIGIEMIIEHGVITLVECFGRSPHEKRLDFVLLTFDAPLNDYVT